jgi:hypothetical protein
MPTELVSEKDAVLALPLALPDTLAEPVHTAPLAAVPLKAS